MSGLKWGRVCRLTVGDDSTELDLSQFRIKFVVEQAMVGKPGTAEIYVYNVSPETAAKVREEGQTVTLEAGYVGQPAVIFQGEVRQRYLGRESQTDTFLRIVAATADRAHRYCVVLKTLRAPSPDEIFKATAEEFAKMGAEVGYVPQLPETRLPRGKVMYGMARDFLDDVCESARFNWGYGNTGIQASEPGKMPQGDPIKINRDTGMVGMPQMTISGLNVVTLLDPRLDINKAILIENTSVQFEAMSTRYADFAQNAQKGVPRLSPDGLYRVVSRQHQGDTRGDAWHTVLICDGINSELGALSGPAITAVPN